MATRRPASALIKTIDRSSVDAAIEEYRSEKNKKRFLDRYGRGTRSDYNLIHRGEPLPSKAIISAAYWHMTGTKITGFSGGMSGSAAVLVNLGYEVDDVTERNPDWDEDELTLALDLYKRVGLAGEKHPAVIELSEFLRAIGKTRYPVLAKSYRNTNGVKLKLANLRAGDPAYRRLEQVGMRRRNRLEAVVWARFGNDAAGLEAAVARIRAHGETLRNEPINDDPAIEEEAEEGGVTYRLHRHIERSAKLRRKKIELARKIDPNLKCEVCSFSFVDEFGAAGDGFAEVHHTNPLHLPRGTKKTSTKDLSILCANCHRIAHRGGQLRSISDLRKLRSI